MANEAELKEKRRQYYLANKERIKEYEKKRKANMTEEEKEAKRAYYRDYYKKKKGGIVTERKRPEKKQEEPKKPACTSKKNLHFDGQPDYVTVVRYPNGIYVIGATTEIESMEYDVEKLLYKLKRYIEKNIEEKVSKEQRIVIVDKFDLSIYVEVYEKSSDYMKEIIDCLDNFINNSLKKILNECRMENN